MKRWLLALLALTVLLSPVVGAPKLVSADTPIATALADLGHNLVIVWGFDAGTKTWLKYDPNVPSVSDLTNLVHGQGYWIQLKTAQTLSSGEYLWNLSAGWNLIGWLEPVPAPRQTIYRNAAKGYSVEVPPGWIVDDRDEGNVMVWSPYGLALVELYYEEPLFHQSLVGWTDVSLSLLIPHNLRGGLGYVPSYFSELSRTEIFLSDGTPAYLSLFQTRRPRASWDEKAWVIHGVTGESMPPSGLFDCSSVHDCANGRNRFRVWAHTEWPNWDKYESVLKHIALGFRQWP